MHADTFGNRGQAKNRERPLPPPRSPSSPDLIPPRTSGDSRTDFLSRQRERPFTHRRWWRMAERRDRSRHFLPSAASTHAAHLSAFGLREKAQRDAGMYHKQGTRMPPGSLCGDPLRRVRERIAIFHSFRRVYRAITKSQRTGSTRIGIPLQPWGPYFHSSWLHSKCPRSSR